MKNTLYREMKPFLASFFALLLAAQLLTPSYVHGAIEAVNFDTPQQEQRYLDLIDELRCLVCQNQNLADSDAELAKDLRQKTLEMLKAGNSDQEILDYMSERYGDFVLYRPPFNVTTSLLWIGPLALLFLVAITVLISIKRKQSKTSGAVIDDAQHQKIRELIDD